MVAILILLLAVMGIWAIAWSMDSYANAQQAQATIEAARAAQTANFTSALMTVLLILLFVAVIGAGALFYLRWKKRKDRQDAQSYQPRISEIPQERLPSGSMDQLVQLATLKILQDILNQNHTPKLSAPQDEEKPQISNWW